MEKNEFIHRAIIAMMSNPYAFGSDSNPLRMAPARLIQEAQDMADFVEQEGIPFDAFPGRRGDGLFVAVDVGADEDDKAPEEPQDPRPPTKEESLEALKARREELHKELCDILDKNSVTNPSRLPKEEMLKYFGANFELRYVRDQMDAIYKSNR